MKNLRHGLFKSHLSLAIYVRTTRNPPLVPPKVVKLGGPGRCRACLQKKLLACSVNVAAIEKWEADVKAGITFSEIPTATICEECRDYDLECLLPRTVALRKALRNKRSREDSDVEVLEPPKPKKSRVTGGTSKGARHAAGPEWLPALRKEMEQLLKEHVKTTAAQARLANILERLANMVEKDKAYIPPSDSSTGSTDTATSADEEEVLKEVESCLEEELERERAAMHSQPVAVSDAAADSPTMQE